MSMQNFQDLEQHAKMLNSMRRVQYAMIQLAEALFKPSEAGFDWIPYISEETGISESHLRSVFFGSEVMTLQDYVILSDYAEIDPINDAMGNAYGMFRPE